MNYPSLQLKPTEKPTKEGRVEDDEKTQKIETTALIEGKSATDEDNLSQMITIEIVIICFLSFCLFVACLILFIMMRKKAKTKFKSTAAEYPQVSNEDKGLDANALQMCQKISSVSTIEGIDDAIASNINEKYAKDDETHDSTEAGDELFDPHAVTPINNETAGLIKSDSDDEMYKKPQQRDRKTTKGS